MPQLSKSAKLYQERKQPDVRTTRRSPGFYHNFRINAVHTMAMSQPAPIADVLQAQASNTPAGWGCCGDDLREGGHPPDGPLTTPWMHGSEEL